MFHLVHFIEEDSIEVVWDGWIDYKVDEDHVMVAFPPKHMYPQLRRYLRECREAQTTWMTYRAKLLYSHGKCLLVYKLKMKLPFLGLP